jgi:hypothetical protein
VQIQRRIERAMETQRRPTAERTLVPNRFVVHLHPEDLAAFADMAGELASGLADEALSFARAHHYSLTERPQVDLVADAAVPRADIRVDGRFTPAHGPEPEHRPADASATGDSADPMATAVFLLPQSRSPRAVLRATDPDGRTREVIIETGGLTIGRAEDNAFVARDVRVSRHHGQIIGRRGTLVYVDLGSTNGSKVNGEPITEVVLGVGDRLEVGDTELVLEVAGATD